MLSETDQKTIANAKEFKSKIPDDVARRMDDFLERTDEDTLKAEKICCKYWSQGWKYKKLYEHACNVVSGEVVDDTNCSDSPSTSSG